MRIGIQFPTSEIVRDPGAIKEFAQGAEALGFHHMTLLEHVLGTASAEHLPGRRYTPHFPVHEPFVLFGFIAAVTSRIELTTSILVLPQRPTALVAKQAAELDVLSGGRLRLGVGVGWNADEFAGLGAEFKDRGARLEEQVEVLRLLWTQEVVTYHGRWHRLEGAGITILPVQRPIPLWMGGGESPRVLRRIGRLSDGWMASGAVDEAKLAIVRDAAREAGRDPASVGLQMRLPLVGRTPEQWREDLQRLAALGATHMVAGVAGGGLVGPEQHLALAERFMGETKDLLSEPITN